MKTDPTPRILRFLHAAGFVGRGDIREDKHAHDRVDAPKLETLFRQVASFALSGISFRALGKPAAAPRRKSQTVPQQTG
jgi:hypothetical protein